MESMKERVALITGATSGIGRETAILFASHGVKVAAAGRNKQAGASLVEEIRAGGGDAIFISADIVHAKDVSAMVAKAVNHFGKLDIAVNNAGIEGVLSPLAEMREEDWDAVMNTNLKGLWLCMKEEISAMRRNGGAIVNISTNLTRFSEPGTGAYTASKAGVETISRIAAVECGKYGIRINAISPGAVDTPLLRRVYPQEILDQLIKNNPLGKIAQPRDIAQAIFWLSSPSSGHVNGTSFALDGGG